MKTVEIQSVAPNVLSLQLDTGFIERGLNLSPDRFTGKRIDIRKLLDPKAFRITSKNDPGFTPPVDLSKGNVYVKSKTTDVAFLNKLNPFSVDLLKWAQEHTIFLELPSNKTFKSGKSYSIDFRGNLNSSLQDITNFTYRPEGLRSEAIHVSQLGYDPDDPKVAFLSLWRGTDARGKAAAAPDHFKQGLRFWIVDADTGRRVEGNNVTRVAELSSRAYVDEDVRDGTQRYANTDVFSLDFSNFKRSGKYHLYVDGVGKSFEFRIAENTWERAFKISMQGLYNQRSGTAIGGPFSRTRYQRSFHPDDGVEVFATDAISKTIKGKQVRVGAVQLIDTDQGLNLKKTKFKDAFARYAKSFVSNGDLQITSARLAQYLSPLKDAWGGYKDAGDWDRRVQHLWGTRQHLELLEIFPDYFKSVDLNIPQTTQSFATQGSLFSAQRRNNMPDLLDESLWSLDFFRRLQNSDGGVRGGIESAAHPQRGEVSWRESQAVFAYAADPWSSYIYAGVAARAARVLKPYNSTLAYRYRQSAIRAMNWAEDELPRDKKYNVRQIRDERNLAALELYLLTEDSRWHTVFLNTTVFSGQQCGPGQPCRDIFDPKSHDQQQAAFLYARAPQRLTRETVRNNAYAAIIRAADNSLAVQNGGTITLRGKPIKGTATGTAFKWTKNKTPWAPLSPGKLATPQVDSLLHAYVLSGDKTFLKAAVLGSQFSAGANPANTVFTTGLVEAGLAKRGPNNPFAIDARLSGQKAPAGITVYGPLDPQFGFIANQRELYKRDTYPNPSQRPVYENYFDNYWSLEHNEFTIHQSIAPTAYTWGFLAASDFTKGNLPVSRPVKHQPTLKLIQLNGTAGADTLQGGSEPNRVLGRSGNDELRGGGGDDTLVGGDGIDKVLGGDGNDRLEGQRGSDLLFGGKGRDVFVLAWGEGRDWIGDFQNGQDRIGLGGGMKYERLSIYQSGKNVAIAAAGDLLAVLKGVNVNAISEADFA